MIRDDVFCVVLIELVNMIVRRVGSVTNMSDVEILSRLYKSTFYANLSDKETDVWHYSYQVLTRLFLDELILGESRYPIGWC